MTNKLNIPYHVRIALSQYGNQFRAELFTEDLGDTEGDLIDADWEILNEHWSDFLMGGGNLSADNAREVGRELFGKLLGGAENSAKWQQILQRAERDNRPIRVLIDSTTNVVRNLPFGLLCDSAHNNYLFRPRKGKPTIRFIRIIRRCTPRPINLTRKPLRILFAVSEPASAGNLGFDAAHRLLEIVQGILGKYQIFFCTLDGYMALENAFDTSPEKWESKHFEPFVKTTRKALQIALEQEEFDILHLMAHGRNGDTCLLCDLQEKPDPITASELGEWCRGNLQIAFLQACKASFTGDQGSFGGIAQQLLNPEYGDLAAVVASPYPIDAEKTTPYALDFYKILHKGIGIDETIVRSGAELDFIWAFLEVWVRPQALGNTGTRGAFQFVSPYRGLARFEERDADIFFGRKTETIELLKLLRDEPIIAVVGDSGSGKSSLLRAGIAHQIRLNGLRNQDNWQIITVTPGSFPANSLITALQSIRLSSTKEESLEAVINGSCSPEQPLLLLFDQFEEILTLCRDSEERIMLTRALGWASKHLSKYIRVIFALRSDYLSRIAALPGIDQAISRPWLLRAPAEEQLRSIVEEPAIQYGYGFEKGLLGRLLQDPLLTSESLHAGSPEHLVAPLPLVEFALEQLWLCAIERGASEFTHQDYDKLGGLGGAIATHAEKVFLELAIRQDFGDNSQHLMEQIMVSLVSTKGTSRPRRLTDIEIEPGNAKQLRKLLNHLVGERLLMLRASRRYQGESEIELAHEVLISKWERLKQWLKRNTETRAFIQEYQRDAERWFLGTPGLLQPRKPENLPSVEKAKYYLDSLEQHIFPLTTPQKEFAKELVEIRAKDAKDKEQLLKALEQADNRAIQLYVRNGTQAVKDGNLWGAWVWFAEALKLSADQNWVEKPHRLRLAGVQRHLPSLRYVWFHDTPAEHVAFSPCGTLLVTYHPKRGESNFVVSLWDCQNFKLVVELSIPRIISDQLNFSEDGSRLLAVIAKGDYKAEQAYYQSWLTNTGKPDITFEATNGAEVITFDSTGQWVLTYDGSTQLQIWDIISCKSIQGPWTIKTQLNKHGSKFILDRTNKRVIVASKDRLWIWDFVDVFSERSIKFERSIKLLKYHRVTKRLIVATQNNEVSFIDLSDQELNKTIVKIGESLESIDINPNGELVLTTIKLKNGNLESRVWSITKRTWLGKTILHEEVVERSDFISSIDRSGGTRSTSVMGFRRIKPFTDNRRAIFAPEGSRILTISERKKAVRVWDWRSGEALTPQINHSNDTIEPASFSSDGCLLATSANDGTTRIWRISIPEADSLAIRRLNRDISFNPNGDLLAIGSYFDTSVVWEVEKFHSLFSLNGVKKFKTFQFSPNGRFLAVATWNNKIANIWNVLTGSPEVPPLQHDGLVKHIIFSPSSQLLLTLACKNDEFNEVRVWKIAGAISIFNTFVFSSRDLKLGAFSPDERSILVVTGDSVTIVYDLLSGEQLFQPLYLDDGIEHATFNENGSEIWTYNNKEIRVWDSKTGLPARPRINNKCNLRKFKACSPDGLKIVMQSKDYRLLQIVDAITGEPCTPPMEHPENVNLVQFSHDGRKLVTSCMKEVYNWDGNTGELLMPPKKHNANINSIALSRTDDKLAIATENIIYLWETEVCEDSVEALILYGQLSSQHRIDSAGGYVPLELEEYRKVWSTTLKRYPNILVSNNQDILWHRQSVHALGHFAKGFHLRNLFNKVQADNLLVGISWHDIYVGAIETCKTGYFEGYKNICNQLLRQLDNYVHLEVDNRTERWNNMYYLTSTCVIRPNDIKDWSLLKQYLEDYVSVEKLSDTEINNFNFLFGAVHFRSGNFDSAVEYLERSEIHPYDWLFLAMTHHFLDNNERAIGFFDRAENNQTETYEWRERSFIELLKDETQLLINQDYGHQ